ncbi:MAG: shikimate kinase [Proteobacteria bacterium]|nr:shikimate kinase [Pseudomonadota bacterium]MBU1612070.1 shikimate kinase [Pseudomonadota bacterium]
MKIPRIERMSEEPCVTLIGIAGAGKTTLGKLIANRLGWAQVDTDRLLEAYYGLPLQSLLDELGLDTFLHIEEHLVAHLMFNRTIIATGGSVVYSPQAVRRLKSFGPIIHLHLNLETFIRRVGDASGRALCIGDKSHEELYRERLPLYEAAADFTVRTDELSVEACAERIINWLAAQSIPGEEKA